MSRSPATDRIPLALAIVAFLLLLLTSYFAALWVSAGEFSYALDDAYIHLSLARSLLDSGVWGINSIEFASVSSSILWPPLIALTASLTGSLLASPFVLNLALSLIAMWVVWLMLRGQGLSQSGLALALFLFAILAPLPILIFSGMEHVLQIVITLLGCSLAARVLAADRVTKSQVAGLLLLAAAMSLVRYEGLFVVAAWCSLLFFARHHVLAVSTAVVAWLPVIAFGLYSRAQGWHFFPNSLLLKTISPAAMVGAGNFSADTLLSDLSGTVITFASQLIITPSLLFLFVASVVLLRALVRAGVSWREPSNTLALTFGFAYLIHMLLGSVDGAVYRYEAYLAALGWVAVLRQWLALRTFASPEQKRILFSPVRIAFCLLLFCGPRMAVATVGTPLGVRGIYEQQQQMAAFLEQYFPGAVVAVNDIGAVSFGAPVRVLDLYGLADVEVADLKLAGKFNTGSIAELAERRNVQIAIIYSDWFEPYGGVPTQWKRVAEWTVPFAFVSAGPSVQFYAVQPSLKIPLHRALRQFEASLPAWVSVRYAEDLPSSGLGAIVE